MKRIKYVLAFVLVVLIVACSLFVKESNDKDNKPTYVFNEKHEYVEINLTRDNVESVNIYHKFDKKGFNDASALGTEIVNEVVD